MAYEMKNNVLVLHKNKFKTEDKHPSYRGEVLVENVKKDASLWVNTNKNGDKYIRITLDEPYVKPNVVDVSTASATPNVEFETTAKSSEEDIPF